MKKVINARIQREDAVRDLGTIDMDDVNIILLRQRLIQQSRRCGGVESSFLHLEPLFSVIFFSVNTKRYRNPLLISHLEDQLFFGEVETVRPRKKFYIYNLQRC